MIMILIVKEILLLMLVGHFFHIVKMFQLGIIIYPQR
jgi:hypothetical protein